MFEYAVDTVDNIRTLDELETYLRRLLEPYGLKNAVYHATKVPGSDRQNPVLSLTYSSDWVKHYLSEDYFQIDPVVIRARSSLLPVDWSQLDRSPQRVRKLFNEAQDAGVGKFGMSLPIRGPNDDHAVLSITSDEPEREWAHLRHKYMRDFQVLGTFIHARVLNILDVNIEPPDYRLSNRERECLQWSAAGKTSDEIGAILGISERSARFYIDGARTKLGCVNRIQAVAKAAALRLIAV